MAKEISKRCGFGGCENYQPSNQQSGCKVFTDRTLCDKSLKHRKAAANTAKKKAREKPNWYNFSKPFWAQNLPSEWDDYAFTADDF